MFLDVKCSSTFLAIHRGRVVAAEKCRVMITSHLSSRDRKVDREKGKSVWLGIYWVKVTVKRKEEEVRSRIRKLLIQESK